MPGAGLVPRPEHQSGVAMILTTRADAATTMVADAAPIPGEAGNFVELDAIDFSFGERKVLCGLSLAISRGKVLVVMGASGSGKTTILRLIGGMLTPQAGRVLINGTVLDTDDTGLLYAMRRQMGMLFQHSALFTDLTAFDNIAFPLREQTNLPESMIRDLVLMKLEVVGLRNAAGLKPGEMSGGMERRVALARATALDPPLVLYDEPFAGLDPIAKGVIARLIRTLNDTLGLTSIIVTQDVEAALTLADALCFLAEGKIVAHGTPAQIRASTQPYVVRFLNASADDPVVFDDQGSALAQDFGLAPPPA